jgi:aspartyl-tRNA(Asn)/glutamyl-tRNA(Gln) amidotransferase subunit A
MTILETATALRAKSFSSTELVEESLRNIEKAQPKWNAFMTVTAASARAEAKQADAELRAGKDRGPLHGIPIAHKDLFCTRGVKTTAGSRIYADYVPDFDATAVRKLRDAGAIMLGKTGLHECAYGITSNNPHYGAVRNPWDPERIPGGSSGGSAAAVAGGLVLMATGSDTGGSIRCPASYCGIVGLKPTFGLASKYGVLPLGYSLDHVGPLAWSVLDVAIALQAMAGYDRSDACSVRRATVTYLPSGEVGLRGCRVGLPENFYFDRIDPAVHKAVQEMGRKAESLGAELISVRVPDIAQLNIVARMTLLAEAAAVHEKNMEHRSLFGPDVLALLDAGQLLPATDYLNAQRARRRFAAEFRTLFGKIDCLLAPATPVVAPRIGATLVDIAGEQEDTRLATTRYLRGINAVGLPVLSMPAGLHSCGLPIGMQIVGKPFSEARLIQVGAALEEVSGRLPLQVP